MDIFNSGIRDGFEARLIIAKRRFGPLGCFPVSQGVIAMPHKKPGSKSYPSKPGHKNPKPTKKKK